MVPPCLLAIAFSGVLWYFVRPPWAVAWMLGPLFAGLGAWLGAALVAWWAPQPFWRWSLGVGALWLAFFLIPPAPAVVVVVVDCMRADLLDAKITPGLTKIAERSWRFTQAHAASSWTRSSMPSLMSGRPPIEHGLYRLEPPDKIQSDVKLVAEYFQDQGWATAAFFEQAQLAPAFGYKRGFDSYAYHAGSGEEITFKAIVWNLMYRHVPRYLQLHYLDIHGPYSPQRKWLPKNVPKTALDLHPAKRWRATIKAIRMGEIVPTDADWAAMKIRYTAEMRQLDHSLSWLGWALGWNGGWDKNWVVVTGDHGEQFGEHGAIEHQGAPWESVIRVPLLIHAPAGDAVEITAPVSLMDVLPTLLKGVGFPVAKEIFGRDLAPLAVQGHIEDRPMFAEEYTRKIHHVAVGWQGWKLMRGAEPRLFNLQTDPGETQNLIDQAPEQRARLEGVLAAYFAAQAAHQPVASVDWERAAQSGAVWHPQEIPGLAAQPSAATLRALEALGYMDGDGSDE